ncbi:MAG: dTMP kinase [Promethearchaeota archaeon]
MRKGFFIVFEGIDGCGSTTHSKMLGEYLDNLGYKTYITQEPSNLLVGRLLRDYLKKSDIPPPTDALLFAADRVEHYYNEILPKIQSGFIVICDRYLESSIAYQCAQSLIKYHVTNTEFSITEEWIECINKFAPLPDLTIILDIDPKISLQRKYKDEQALDKFETIEFLNNVRKIYLNRAKSKNYYVLDANNSIEIVSENIIKVVKNLLRLK